jgi:hypothetical protein
MARSSILTLLAALLAVVHADAIYTKNSPVLQVDAKSYDTLIAQSNHTSASPTVLSNDMRNVKLIVYPDSRVILPSALRPLPKDAISLHEPVLIA